MRIRVRDGPAEAIRSALPAARVAESYGFQPNRTGYIICPFHREKSPSLKLYPGDRGWHCFGCGRGGDVIRFVMELFGITFPQAMVRLSSDFGLGLYTDRPGLAARSKIAEERRREKQEREELLARLRKLSQEICYWNEIRRYFAPDREDQKSWYVDPRYLEALERLPYLEYQWDELENRIKGVNSFE